MYGSIGGVDFSLFLVQFLMSPMHGMPIANTEYKADNEQRIIMQFEFQ